MGNRFHVTLRISPFEDLMLLYQQPRVALRKLKVRRVLFVAERRSRCTSKLTGQGSRAARQPLYPLGPGVQWG